LLSIEDIYVSYGDLKVLSSVNFHVDEKEIVCLIGGNGAGKSTMINTISGINIPRRGRIKFFDEKIDRKKAHVIVEKGIIQVPEGRRIFPSLSVLENLEMGSFLPKAKKRRKEALEEVYSLFPILKDRIRQQGGTLSGGEQQMLAIGRGLMSAPKLLMLDEPSLGLAPIIVSDIFKTITNINSRGTTIFIVEQNIEYTLDMADRGYVLENGSIVLEGKGKNLLENPHIKEAYLGF